MKAVSFAIVIVALIAASAAASIVGDGALSLAVAPALALALFFTIWKVPLRYPMFVLTFLVLTLENPSEAPAEGLWKSPLYQVGALLLTHWNLTSSHKWLIFSGVDIALVTFLGIALYRWLARSPIDLRGHVESAAPLRMFLVLSLAGAAWMWIYGMAQGGADFASSLWQVQRVVYLPMFCFVFLVALREHEDRVTLGKIFVVAACIKSVLAIYIHATVAPPPGEAVLGYATTHEDSMLFAGAFCILVAPLFEKFDRRRIKTCLFVLPLLLWGMVANHRRLVWVELLVALAVIFALTPWTRAKRSICRGFVLASPLSLPYIAIGWESSASIFSPVQTIRSVIDSNADASTAWRDWENYDLFYTIRQHPLFGVGYGHGYTEIVKLPDISQSYSLYRFIPHNSILGLLAYGGFVGFTALWMMLVVGVYLAVRSHRFAKTTNDRVTALAALTAFIVFFVHCYGDMGLGTWTGVFLVAPALAVVGHLAVSTGAWPQPAGARIRIREIFGMPEPAEPPPDMLPVLQRTESPS